MHEILDDQFWLSYLSRALYLYKTSSMAATTKLRLFWAISLAGARHETCNIPRVSNCANDFRSEKMSTHPLLLLSWLLVLAFAGSLRLHLHIPIPCQLQVQIVRWGCAVPVTVRGKILPMSDTKHESNFVSLYWWRGLMSNLSKGSSFGGSGLLRRRRSISWYSASFKSRGW